MNPSLSVCFFCGEDKALILFGHMKGEAPKRVLVDYEPCDKCAEIQRRGVTIIEVTTTDTGCLPIQDGAWPTGRWCVITKELGLKLFGEADHVLLEVPLYESLMEVKK